MSCDKDCNQGRNCNCSRAGDRVVIAVAVMLTLSILGMGYGIYKLLSGVM